MQTAYDGVAKADVVGLHPGPGGETTKTRAATVVGLDGGRSALVRRNPAFRQDRSNLLTYLDLLG